MTDTYSCQILIVTPDDIVSSTTEGPKNPCASNIRQILPKPVSDLSIFLNNAPVMKDIESDNFQDICRCCVVNKGDMNIFETHFQNISFADLIYFCTNEKIVPTDDMPKSVCNVCTQEIINSFMFSRKVKNMQVHIRELQKIFLVKYEEHCSDTSISYNLPNYNNTALLEKSNCHNETSSVQIFKRKYKGLTDVYKKLCAILLENKRQIKKPKKTTHKKRTLLFEKCDVKEISQEGLNSKPPDEGIEVIASGGPRNEVKLNQNENYSVTDDNNFSTDDGRIENQLKSENCQIEELAQDNFINIAPAYKECDKSGVIIAEEMKCPDEDTMEITSTVRNEYILSECYREAVNGDIVNCEVYTVSERELEKNLGVLIQSSFNDISTNNNDDFVVQDEIEEAKEGISGTQCFECPEVFETEAGIIRHCRLTGHVMTDRFKCKLCSSTFRLLRVYRKHVLSHNKTKCICEICGARVSSTNLKRHMEVHTDITKNVCQFCGRTYIHKSILDGHIKRKHFGLCSKCLCFLCGKSFDNATDLNKHLNDKHREDGLADKTYQCEICERYFITEVSLTFHQKYSHAEDPVNRKRYRNNKELSDPKENGNRMKRHKQPKPKQCTVCLKFVNPAGYKIHMLIHQGLKPFECKICNKSFRQDCHLKSHMNIHLNLRPFKCKYCHKCFRHGGTLITHVRGHLGERPYKCRVCGKGFVHSTAMKKHCQIHFKTKKDVSHRRQ